MFFQKQFTKSLRRALLAPKAFGAKRSPAKPDLLQWNGSREHPKINIVKFYTHHGEFGFFIEIWRGFYYYIFVSSENNKPQLQKEQVFTVRIYFIDPIELISVVMNTLIKLEFETYSISMAESQYMMPILKRSLRNIIFICVNSARDAEHWLQYIDKLDKLEDAHIQVGIFAYNNISDKLKMAFLERRAAVIRYSDLQENTLSVIKKILVYFEAKGQRKFVRAKASGISEAFFTVKNLEEAVRGEIQETSAAAFSCRIPQAFRIYFNKGDSFDQVLLVLRGIRVRVSAQVLGFDQKEPEVFIFKLCTAKIEDNKLIYVDGLLPEVKVKIHTYIRMCLRSQIASELEAYSLKDKAANSESKKEE